MTTDAAGSRVRLREQIETADDLGEEDREALVAFSDRLALLNSEYSDRRHETLLTHCAIMGGLAQRIDESELPNTELRRALEDREAAEDLGRWINGRYESEASNRGARPRRVAKKRGYSVFTNLAWPSWWRVIR